MAIDPFSPEGARRIAEITGQNVASPIPATVLSQQTQPLNLPNPSIEPVPTVPTLDSILSFEETPADRRQQTILDDTADTATKLAQEETFRIQQEQELGLNARKATVRDLTSQFNSLNVEADAIPLQIQEEFTGRGATSGGVESIQTSRLRNNTIRRLGVSAALNAANGNLATAMDQVETAVRAKFAPLRAQLEAKKAQLAALEPTLDREEKRRAAVKQAKYAERERLLDKQEADRKGVYEVMLQAAAAGADAVTIRKIQDAKTPGEAVAAAGSVLGRAYTDKLAQQQFDNELAALKAQIDQTKVTTSGGGKAASSAGSGMNSLAATVIANPELFNQLTPTEKAKIAPSLAAAGFNAFGKPLSDTAITSINQTNFALTSLADLRAKIQSNVQFVGPVKGLAALNPFSKARRVQADVNRVRQTVGKALEGGVLRKEDEEKYKTILATLTDTPETALYKIDALSSSIEQNLANYKALQAAAGRTDLSAPSLNADDLRTKYAY